MDPTDPLYRYHRQTLLEGVGQAGQLRLGEGHAMVVGMGALGCPAADLLVRAGVGRVTLVDRDVVELTNLQRQTLYCEDDARAGRPKVEAARRRLVSVNSSVRIEALGTDLEPCSAEATVLDGPLGRPGVVLDATDNFETRFLVNDLAVKHAIPLVYAGAVASRGVSMTVRSPKTPCLRCQFDPPEDGGGETCDTVGVLGPIAAMMGAFQASEAIKLLLGRVDLTSTAMVSLDLWELDRRWVELGARDPGCVCCGRRRFEFLDSSRTARAIALCGQGSVQISPAPGSRAIDLSSLAQSLQNHGRFLVEHESVRGALDAECSEDGGRVRLTVFSDGRAIVGGVTDPQRARGVYARYVGG